MKKEMEFPEIFCGLNCPKPTGNLVSEAHWSTTSAGILLMDCLGCSKIYKNGQMKITHDSGAPAEEA